MHVSFRYFVLPVLMAFACLVSFSQTPHLPTPSSKQQQWMKMDYYLFVHFGPNTFTDLEWGKGNEKEEVFNPSQLDCRQWCRIAKAAGAKGIIITAKHHDGFCLWPSQYSKHTVRESDWCNGKGDVLEELSKACREYGLKMGVYLSPWDRNHPKYGTAEYNEVFVNMMKEVVSRYGPFFEFWWDGANGEGPNGKKQIYNWQQFESTMQSIAPNTAVFSDIGPDIRWVGNEQGIAGDTNWNTLDTAGFKRGEDAPPNDTLSRGNRYGKVFLPAECDVSIRPGWFYHASEDTAVKTAQQLFGLYLESVGRGASLLLNVPPDRRGLFTPYDSAALMDFKKIREESFANNLCLQAKITMRSSSELTKRLTDNNESTLCEVNRNNPIKILFTEPQTINCITLKEYLLKGQSIAGFHVSFYDNNNNEIQTVTGTTIGRQRILTFPSVKAKSIVITLDKEDAPALLSEIGAYKIDDSLIEK